MAGPKEIYHRMQLRQMRAGEVGAETEMDIKVTVYEGGPRVLASVAVTTVKPQQGYEATSDPLRIQLQHGEHIRELGLKLMEIGLRMEIAEKDARESEANDIRKAFAKVRRD